MKKKAASMATATELMLISVLIIQLPSLSLGTNLDLNSAPFSSFTLYYKVYDYLFRRFVQSFNFYRCLPQLLHSVIRREPLKVAARKILSPRRLGIQVGFNGAMLIGAVHPTHGALECGSDPGAAARHDSHFQNRR